MKKALKFLSLGLVMCMCMSMAVAPAFADVPPPKNSFERVDNISDYNMVGIQDVNVFAVVGSNYSVTIPKTITLAGAKGASTANYTVKVSGDIADNEKVIVAPTAMEFQMTTAKGDKTATATIEQDKTEWAYNEFSTQATGKIRAPLTAGTWNGNFSFDISLDEEVTLITFTVNDTPYQAEAGMIWTQWIDSEYNTEDWTTVYVNNLRTPDGNLIVENSYILANTDYSENY